jgi:hypothetical protein
VKAARAVRASTVSTITGFSCENRARANATKAHLYGYEKKKNALKHPAARRAAARRHDAGLEGRFFAVLSQQACFLKLLYRHRKNHRDPL